MTYYTLTGAARWRRTRWRARLVLQVEERCVTFREDSDLGFSYRDERVRWRDAKSIDAEVLSIVLPKAPPALTPSGLPAKW